MIENQVVVFENANPEKQIFPLKGFLKDNILKNLMPKPEKAITPVPEEPVLTVVDEQAEEDKRKAEAAKEELKRAL